MCGSFLPEFFSKSMVKNTAKMLRIIHASKKVGSDKEKIAIADVHAVKFPKVARNVA